MTEITTSSSPATGCEGIGMAEKQSEQQPARGDRVLIVGAHPWSGYAGVVVHVSPMDGGITVGLDCGLRATVADPKYYRLALSPSTESEASNER